MELTELNLTQEQIEGITKYVQSETDKVRTKYSKELSDLKEKLPTEPQKSAKEIELENLEKQLKLKEQEITSKEKSFQIADKLSEKGLPKELAKYLSIGEDLDSTIEEVGTVVNSYFLNNGNKPGNHSKNQAITKEQFKAMSYNQRAKLFAENPELYKAYSN